MAEGIRATPEGANHDTYQRLTRRPACTNCLHQHPQIGPVLIWGVTSYLCPQCYSMLSAKLLKQLAVLKAALPHRE